MTPTQLNTLLGAIALAGTLVTGVIVLILRKELRRACQKQNEQSKMIRTELNGFLVEQIEVNQKRIQQVEDFLKCSPVESLDLQRVRIHLERLRLDLTLLPSWIFSLDPTKIGEDNSKQN